MRVVKIVSMSMFPEDLQMIKDLQDKFMKANGVKVTAIDLVRLGLKILTEKHK